MDEKGNRLALDGEFQDLYGNSRIRSQKSRGEASPPRYQKEREESLPRYRKEREESLPRYWKVRKKPTVELEIKTILEADIYGNKFVVGFCYGFYGSVVINLGVEKSYQSNTDYIALFDEHCCKGKNKHIFK